MWVQSSQRTEEGTGSPEPLCGCWEEPRHPGGGTQPLSHLSNPFLSRWITVAGKEYKTPIPQRGNRFQEETASQKAASLSSLYKTVSQHSYAQGFYLVWFRFIVLCSSLFDLNSLHSETHRAVRRHLPEFFIRASPAVPYRRLSLSHQILASFTNLPPSSAVQCVSPSLFSQKWTLRVCFCSLVDFRSFWD